MRSLAAARAPLSIGIPADRAASLGDARFLCSHPETCIPVAWGDHMADDVSTESRALRKLRGCRCTHRC